MDKQEDRVHFNVQLFRPTPKSTVPKWAFKLNSGLTAAETWDCKGHMLKVKYSAHPKLFQIQAYHHCHAYKHQHDVSQYTN
jgi:hypothetical protein